MSKEEIVYLDRSFHVWSCFAEIEQGNNRASDGQPVDESNVVDEGIHVGGGQIDEREPHPETNTQ